MDVQAEIDDYRWLIGDSAVLAAHLTGKLEARPTAVAPGNKCHDRNTNECLHDKSLRSRKRRNSSFLPFLHLR